MLSVIIVIIVSIVQDSIFNGKNATISKKQNY